MLKLKPALDLPTPKHFLKFYDNVIIVKMVFPNFSKNINFRNAVDNSFGRYPQHDSKNKDFFNVRVVGDAASNFVFDRLIKLNSSETAGHTSSKLINTTQTYELVFFFKH